MRTSTLSRPCSTSQVALIATLCSERVLTAHLTAQVGEARGMVMAGLLSHADASALISALIAAPRTARTASRATAATSTAPTTPTTPTMPDAGHYAVMWNGDLKFYVVREGKGTHAGRRFLNRFRSDYLDRPGTRERADVVAAILADPATARETFARETVCCYRCGRRLTDETSRGLGIGPDCRSRA